MEINKQRIVDEFIELVKIASLSRDERAKANVIKQKLEEMGVAYYEDEAGKTFGGNTGNIIASVPGCGKDSILFAAHMDTVRPGKHICPVVEGDIVRGSGDTILGGDDNAGIVCMLELMRMLQAEQMPKNDKEAHVSSGINSETKIENNQKIWFVFTPAEEVGMLGARALDIKRIGAKFGFVLDGSGKAGMVDVSAPSHYTLNITIKGKAAHAGIEPENGISAITVAAKAISEMKLGRLDAETTANVGIIQGGTAENIVCDTVILKAETRSRNEQKLEAQLTHMKKCITDTCVLFGAEAIFDIEKEYTAFDIKAENEIMGILETAAQRADIELIPGKTGGGSDTNVFNEKGIESVNLCVGMDKPHTLQETLDLKELFQLVNFSFEIATSDVSRKYRK